MCNMLSYLSCQQAACAMAAWRRLGVPLAVQGNCGATCGLRLLAVAVQNNLDSIQGQQRLQLLGLPQVMELCTGTVIAGGPPSCPFLFRHPPTALLRVWI